MQEILSPLSGKSLGHSDSLLPLQQISPISPDAFKVIFVCQNATAHVEGNSKEKSGHNHLKNDRNAVTGTLALETAVRHGVMIVRHAVSVLLISEY